MKSLKAHISTILTMVILVGSLLPALHTFHHESTSSSESDITSIHNYSNASVDCALCDFHLTTADNPVFYSYEIYFPQKESIYAISLAETINLSQSPLFSLRAPPVVIS